MTRLSRSMLMLTIAMSLASAKVQGSTEPDANSTRTHFPSVDEVVRDLNSNDSEIRRKTASRLGIVSPESGMLCSDFNSIRIEQFHSDAKSYSKLVIANSSYCRMLVLIPIIKRNGGWRPLDAIVASNQFSNPEYRLVSLLSPEQQEIVISHQTVDEGTGVLQRNLTIYKIIGDRIRVILDEPELIRFAVPDARVPETSNYSDEQVSVFSFVRNDVGDPGLFHVVEKREETHAGQKVIVYRTYNWSAQLLMFRMYCTQPPD